MDINERYSSSACALIGIPISIVVGIIIGVLFALGLIPSIVTAVWIVLGLAVLTLIILVLAVFAAVSTESKVLSKCIKQNICCLLAGIIGTIITVLAALSIQLVTTSILIAILVGIGAFFASLMIISLIIFILCVADRLNCAGGGFSIKI